MTAIGGPDYISVVVSYPNYTYQVFTASIAQLKRIVYPKMKILPTFMLLVVPNLYASSVEHNMRCQCHYIMIVYYEYDELECNN